MNDPARLEPDSELPEPTPLPEGLQRRMGLLLWGGLLIACVPLAVALAAFLLENPSAGLATTLRGNPMRPFLTPSGIASGLIAGAPGAYLTVGIGLLIAIPVLRVGLAAYYFDRAGEKELSRVTLLTFLTLLLALLVVGPLLATA